MGIIKGNQQHERQCYQDNLNLQIILKDRSSNSPSVHYANLDPWGDPGDDNLKPVEVLKIIKFDL